MSTQTNPTQQSNPVNDLINGVVNSLVQQALQQAAQNGPGLIMKLFTGLFNSLFHRAPSPPMLGPQVVAPVVSTTPTQIPMPPVSVPSPGLVTRIVSSVRLVVQKAEKPDLSTPERRQDPGNLFDNPMGMVASGSAFNFGTTFWFDQTAFDANGDEWQGNSIVAAGKEYKTRHEVWKNGQLVAFIQGQGGSDDHTPFDWQQQTSDDVNVIRSRPWIDSIGMNVGMRLATEGEFIIKSWFDGVKANELTVKVS